MTVFANSLTLVKNLLEGSFGETRIIAANTFDVLESDSSYMVNRANKNPRPAIIEVLDDVDLSGMPSDVSGNYYYVSKRVDVYIAYADYPEDKLALEAVIDNHKIEILSALTYPLNWISVDGLVGISCGFRRQSEKIDDAAIDIEFLICELTIICRETL